MYWTPNIIILLPFGVQKHIVPKNNFLSASENIHLLYYFCYFILQIAGVHGYTIHINNYSIIYITCGVY